MDLPALEKTARALETSLDSIEGWLALSTALVVIGLILEYWHDVRELIDLIKKRPPFPWRKLQEIVGGIFVVAGVGGELALQFRASNLESRLRSTSHQIEGLLNEKAGAADERAGEANKDAGAARTVAGYAIERAAKNEREAALLEREAAALRKTSAQLRLDTAKAQDSAAKAILELAKFKSPRELTEEKVVVLLGKLKPFAGTPFVFTGVYNDLV